MAGMKMQLEAKHASFAHTVTPSSTSPVSEFIFLLLKEQLFW
jgi:hypothetical protein